LQAFFFGLAKETVVGRALKEKPARRPARRSGQRNRHLSPEGLVTKVGVAEIAWRSVGRVE
jgi:hypothetical protein